MKYIALATIVLLLLPLAFVPLSTANQPAWNVEFRIRPTGSEFVGPCVVSTEFTKDVYLWNDKTLTNVGVYAYDFYVYWKNNVGISLVDFVNHIPWPSGSYFLVVNETGIYAPDTTFSFYHVAVTAIGNSTLNPALELGATGVFNASLVTLTFHIDNEPFWPGSVETGFWIGNDLGAYLVNFWTAPYPGMSFPVADPNFYPKVSTGCTPRIWNLEVDNGFYSLVSSKPEIDPEATLTAPFPDNVTSNSIGSTFSVYIHLKNILGAYGFGFNMTFDPAWKKVDIQHMTILPAFAPPYEYVTMKMNTTEGWVYVELRRPCEKATIHGADFAVIKIDFVETATPEKGKIPFENTTAIALTDAWVNIKNSTWTGIYDFIEFDAIKLAADRLVELQGTTDPGWDWDNIQTLTAHSATYPSPKNTFGVTAIGLSEAYMLTHNAAYLTAALKVANYWLALGDPTTGVFRTAGFGYSWDYRFLMEITAITGNPSYADFALKSWTWTKANVAAYADGNQGSGAGTLWDHYANGWIGTNKYGAAAWGTGDWGLAALAMGDTTWANHMAAVIHANMANILATPVDTDYKDMGIGKALEFFATLGDPAYAADIQAMIDQLKTDQLADDSWGYGPLYPGDVQTTAYVVLGLCAAGEHVLCQQGVDWLVANQLTTGVNAGGWDLGGGYEISEVDSEALKAIVTCNGYSGDLLNIFKPKSTADLNLDGVVDIEDLALVAEAYGTASPYALLVAPGGNVDIFDIVYVAKRYGDP